MDQSFFHAELYPSLARRKVLAGLADRGVHYREPESLHVWAGPIGVHVFWPGVSVAFGVCWQWRRPVE